MNIHSFTSGGDGGGDGDDDGSGNDQPPIHRASLITNDNVDNSIIISYMVCCDDNRFALTNNTYNKYDKKMSLRCDAIYFNINRHMEEIPSNTLLTLG